LSHKDNVARGIKLYQDGKGIFARTPDQIIEDARKGGNVQGPKNRDSGHWARVSQLSDRVAAAEKAGAIAVETGQIYEIRSYEASVRGGKTQGKIAVDTGHWEKVAPRGLHVRWHLKGSTAKDGTWVDPKPNPRCDLCIQEGLIIAFG
jgi:hypothetical protein